MSKLKIIVDVRTREEFEEGHYPGSINIPLDQLESELTQIQSFPTPLQVCCRSGHRSGQAVVWLRQQGVDAVNVGGWTDLL